MINLELLKAELISDEGIRLKPYQDSLGYWTIGVGHLLHDHTLDKISEEEALRLLMEDITECINDIQSEAWFQACNNNQKRALLNMRFQLGSLGLRTFKNSLRLIEKQQWSEAGKALRQSTWYKQTPNRAERVIRMIESGS